MLKTSPGGFTSKKSLAVTCEKWKDISNNIQKLDAVETCKSKRQSQIEILEQKFCSSETKKLLNQTNFSAASFYTKISAETNYLSSLPTRNSKLIVDLPPLTSRITKRITRNEKGRATCIIHKRPKRKRLMQNNNSLAHTSSTSDLSQAPKALTKEVEI